MKVSVCIGSSCHIKGSRLVVEELQRLINEHNLEDKVKLCGAFCKGNCQQDVSVTVNEENFSVNSAKVCEFFDKEILPRV